MRLAVRRGERLEPYLLHGRNELQAPLHPPAASRARIGRPLTCQPKPAPGPTSPTPSPANAAGEWPAAAVNAARPARQRGPETPRPYHRTEPLSVTPCSGGPLSLAGSRRVASRLFEGAARAADAVPAPGSRPRLRLPAPGSRLPAPGSRLPAPGSRLPAPGSRLPAPGSRLPLNTNIDGRKSPNQRVRYRPLPPNSITVASPGRHSPAAPEARSGPSDIPTFRRKPLSSAPPRGART